MAKEKDLTIVSGLCWRYHLGVRETMKRIADGAIGDVLSVQENYLTGPLWHRGDRSKFDSEMEYQLRNWYYFTWLSGDHIVEQFIHSLDKSMWLMGDTPPAKCVGLGGRQVRTEEKWGNIYDHHAVCYEWANGFKSFAYTRQMRGCKNNVEDYVQGSKGRALVLAHQIEPNGADAWTYTGENPSMYDNEHVEMFRGIRSGNTINNGQYMSYSTMLAIMGRMAAYTGKKLTWDDVLKSTETFAPESLSWDTEPPVKPGADGLYPVPIPGFGKLS